MANESPYAYLHTAGADAETVLRGASNSNPGVLGSIIVNTGAAGSVTIRDDAVTGGSNVVAVVDTAAPTDNYYCIQMLRGMTYAKVGAADVTIAYR